MGFILFQFFISVLLILTSESSSDEVAEDRGLNHMCVYYERDVQYEEGKGGPSDTPCCEINGEILELIGFENTRKDILISGLSRLMIPDLVIENGKIYIPDGESSKVLIENNSYKIAATSTGVKSVLAIRVIALDESTTSSLSTMSDKIFGTVSDSLNMKSQFEACSHNQLIMNAYTGTTSTGETVTDGVGEVNIYSNVSGIDRYTVEELVKSAATTKYGYLPSQFDHVLICLPPGTADYWLAYGYYDYYLTVYNDDWCNMPSAQMHEMGHNLNLMHSGDSVISYGDKSGLMGYSYYSDETPEMCFNGPKSWQLGWYSDGHVTIDTQSLANPSFSGFLIGVNDYQKNNLGSNKMIIQINVNNMDYYVMFNLATGINSGVVQNANRVMITSRVSGSYRAVSLLEVSLASGEEYSIPDTSYSVEVATMDFSASPPYAEVIVRSSLTPSSSPSDGTTLVPTTHPTFVPSAFVEPSDVPSVLPSDAQSYVPSDVPFVVPSVAPSDAPSDGLTLSSNPSFTLTGSGRPTLVPSSNPTSSARPSLKPTTSPTPAPTTSPTINVTSNPTSSPTPDRTASPILGPTSKPTLVPTISPSPAPTASPTLIPTTYPTLDPTSSPTLVPTSKPTLDPTSSPTLIPTSKPTLDPPSNPTLVPTSTPTLDPTSSPTLDLTASPTFVPTASPTVGPTSKLTSDPSFSPTLDPTTKLTLDPSSSPTLDPTTKLTSVPTSTPTPARTASPTIGPTSKPTLVPTTFPTPAPTTSPTLVSTTKPTLDPTSSPSLHPTSKPTLVPTTPPTPVPTLSPAAVPTPETRKPKKKKKKKKKNNKNKKKKNKKKKKKNVNK